jgi:hypothetical protein
VFHLVCLQNISVIFDYILVRFYADHIKHIILPVRGFQNCMEIQSDLN